MRDASENLKSLLVNYASRYAVELPEVLAQVRARCPNESSSYQLELARRVVLECIEDGTIALLRLNESREAVCYGEQSAQRLAEGGAWDWGDAPGDFLAATALREATADVDSEDRWLAWE